MKKRNDEEGGQLQIESRKTHQEEEKDEKKIRLSKSVY